MSNPPTALQVMQARNIAGHSRQQMGVLMDQTAATVAHWECGQLPMTNHSWQWYLLLTGQHPQYDLRGGS